MGIAYNTSLVTDGLVFSIDAANFRSYSGSGNTANGLVSGIGGTLVNGVGFTTDNNGSFVFDGTNDYIELGDNFDMGLSSYSFCTYFKAAVIQGVIFGKWSEPGAAYMAYIYNNRKGTPYIEVVLDDENLPIFLGRSVTSSISINTNTWYHISVVYNRADKLYLYINGVLNSSVTISDFQSRDLQSSYNFRIGNRHSGVSPFNGNIAQLQIYNRALSATEIKQNYNAIKKRFGY